MFRVLVSVVPFLIFCAASVNSWAQEAVKIEESDQIKATQTRYGLDPNVPLLQRLGETPESVLTIFREAGMSPKPHSLNDDERRKIREAIEILPPLHQYVLKQRLRNISLLDDMPNTALTSIVNFDEPHRLFDITIRAAILQQSASEWMTEKESSCFNWKDSEFSLRAEVGNITAIQYVLLHEATHIVDATKEITPSLIANPGSVLQQTVTPFTAGVWDDARTPVDRYKDEGLMAIRFRPGGKTMEAAKMQTLYEALGQTPFVSLYGSSNRTEDLAEYLTAYHLTQKLNQPYRISIYKGDEEVLRHDPMTSEITRSRFELMKQFYDLTDSMQTSDKQQ